MGIFKQADIATIDSENKRVYGKDNPNNKVYSINEVVVPSEDYTPGEPTCCIGLFVGEPKWEGRGNFCGWYGAEFYLDTTLLAYYVIENVGYCSFKGHDHIKEVRLNQHFDELLIGSCYWTKKLYAPSDDVAIEHFFGEGFE